MAANLIRKDRGSTAPTAIALGCSTASLKRRKVGHSVYYPIDAYAAAADDRKEKVAAPGDCTAEAGNSETLG